MTAPPPAETIYLEAAGDPVCLIFHPPAEEAARDTAVIICPPFGWDEVCSYRSRRDWAQQLALAGYPTVRLSLPSTGDSGAMPRDPDRLEAWTASVTACERWLRAVNDASRSVAIGIGLGGLVAWRAAATGASIDDLVLWATPARGSALIRQLRAFSTLEASQLFEGLEPPAPSRAGELEAGGFVLSAQTVKQLEGLDLRTLPLPARSSRRALLLERDGIAVDARLREELDRQGVEVTVAPGDGYAAMTEPPQEARAPIELIKRVIVWLDGAPPTAPTVASASWSTAGASHSAYITLDGESGVKETPLAVQQPFGSLAGILAEPPGTPEPGLCVVLLNAGATRRIGPNRMWVEAARRWAARGVPVLRLDVEGIGDADGDAAAYVEDAGLYVPELVPQVLSALDVLQEMGIGERFVLGGLCSGAYWSLHAALQDRRVVAALMVNARLLVWDPGAAPAHDFRVLRTKPLSWSKLRGNASAARAGDLARWMLSAPKRNASLDGVLERLQASGKRAVLLFSDDEPLHLDLIRSGRMAQLERWPNVTVEHVPVRDHTLRPTSSQRQVHQALDRALERELVISRAADPAAPTSGANDGHPAT